MKKQLFHTLGILFLTLVYAGLASALTGPYNPSREYRGPVRPNFANPNKQNRVHNAGKMWMNVTNYGYFGNDQEASTSPLPLKDPCPPKLWAPQCEYPGGSGQQYLFMADVWVGALIVEKGFETKRVSVGTDGWLNPPVNEFWPGEGESSGIVERSTRKSFTNCLGVMVEDPAAISDQDFICTYTDTLTDPNFVINDDVDGKHRPLGIKITQTSYSFSQAFAEDFILIDYQFENIASNFLKNLYVGLYVDADVMLKDASTNEVTDDICGYVRSSWDKNAQGDSIEIPIDVAWIADNDGRSYDMSSGPFTTPHVTGTRVIRGPNPRLKTSFNWWVSNGDVTKDYGPSWEAYCDRDSMGMSWTRIFGTPMGDERKYQVMSNGEFDFWQIMVDRMSQVAPQPYVNPLTGDTVNMSWCRSDPSADSATIADGYDTRYLLSWGPLGIRDYQDQSGRWIYRLNPGEKFSMTIAYVGGENFHNINHPQPSNTHIDSSLFDFSDLRQNARWAKDVYDNRMKDTPQYNWGPDHIPNSGDEDPTSREFDTGDGWSGEDVGTDGIYAVLPPGVDSVAVVYFRGSIWQSDTLWYHGPDLDGTERNGRIDPVNNPRLDLALHRHVSSEDDIIPSDMYYILPGKGYWDMGWMSGNGLLDMGDGIPDFTGPPPPQVPILLHCVKNTENSSAIRGGKVFSNPLDTCYVGGLGYELTDNEIILRWSKKACEDSTDPKNIDPFSGLFDFEGYRILVANINQDEYYSLKAEFDRVDFAFFSEGNDSMMTVPQDSDRVNWDTIRVYDSRDFGDPLHPTRGIFKPVGPNTGLKGLLMDPTAPLKDAIYEYRINAYKLAPIYYAITAYDFGDPKSGLGPLSTKPTANAVMLAPAGSKNEPVRVVPNPYRAYTDYTRSYSGISWENMNDRTRDFYPQQDRRIEFINLPDRCLIRIYTAAGDLVALLPHNEVGDESIWASMTSERWDLNSRNKQQVVSGIYLFSVEDSKDHSLQTGKFVIIR